MRYHLVLLELYRVIIEYTDNNGWAEQLKVIVAVDDDPKLAKKFAAQWLHDNKEDIGWVSYKIMATEFIYDSFWMPTATAHKTIEV